ncbi:MAG: LamG-like jellyroll fold domain-containing protein, partial [Methylococcaceae bacterium]
DGLNDRVQNIPAGPLAYSSGGDRTFALWLWPDHHDTGGGVVFSKPWNGNGAYNYSLNQLADSRLQWQVQGVSLIAPMALTPDQWHQVVITIKSNWDMSMYLDGQLAASGQFANTWSAKGGDQHVPLCIGSLFPYGVGWDAVSTYSWQGKLDDLRVYSRALPADEIRQSYDRGKPAAGFPMVTLLMPASTHTITSQTHLQAETQDVAGIAGVTFEADGQALAAEDKKAPYEMTLPNRLVNGVHSFTAVARNVSGNITTSSPVQVTMAGNNGVIAQPVEPISPLPILPDTWPVPGIAGNEIQITAATDQYEAASFVLRSVFQDYNSVTLEVSDLSGPGGRLPKEEVDIRLVKAWYQASLGGWIGGAFIVGDYTQRLVPELLLKDESLVQVGRVAKKNYLKINRGAGDELVWVNIPEQMNAACFKVADFPFQDSGTLQPFFLPKQYTQQVWLTVHAPRQIKPGTYSGNIIIRAGRNELGRLTLRVKVPAFTLAEYAAGVYYTSVLDPANATLGSQAKTEIQMRAEMRNMWGHGVKDFTLYQPLNQMENILKLRQDMGMIRGALYAIVCASCSITELNNTVPQLVKLAHAYGFSDAFLYGSDEATGTALTAQRLSWRRVHELGGKIFVAGSGDAFDLVGDLLDVQVHAGRPIPEYAKKWHGIGHNIYSYGNPQSGAENPYPLRRNYGLVLWAAGYDKAYTWAYQAVRGNQWNDIDASQPPKPGQTTLLREENFTYSTANGVIDTLAWEGYREAVDDVRYLKTLEQTIAQAKAATSPLVQQAVADAQTYLNGLRSTVLKLSGTGANTADFNLDLKQKREEVVQHIEAIMASQTKAQRQAMPKHGGKAFGVKGGT